MHRVLKCTTALLFLYFSTIRGENNEIKCELGAFLENLDGTNPILIDSGSVAPVSELKFSCEESGDDCAKIVQEYAVNGTKGGNFTLAVDERDEYTVGDLLCDHADKVEENVRNKIVHIYWRLCGSPWKPTSFKMPEPLCCEDGLYVSCRALRSEL